MKVAVIFGTRPETVKLAPIVKELERRSIDHRVIVTAQHRKMLDQMLDVFGIRPHHDLNIMQENQDLFHITTSVLNQLKPVLQKEKPDIILVQGDTTTTFAAGLAAFYLGIDVGHVEAGLRTWNRRNPFPEEMNRQMTTRLTDVHFPPTAWARKNLLAEGISESDVHITGNTVIDALLMIVDSAYQFQDEPLRSIEFAKNRVILLTAHRRENFGAPMADVFRACRDLVDRFPDTILVYPVHPNPNVRKAAGEILEGHPRIRLIDPLEYRPFVQLMNRSYLIMTDSGGVQEEAPTLGKPVLVLRTTTERPEAIEAGTARLVGTDRLAIVNEGVRLLGDSGAYKAMSTIANPYGDGTAAKQIVDILEKRYHAKEA